MGGWREALRLTSCASFWHVSCLWAVAQPAPTCEEHAPGESQAQSEPGAQRKADVDLLGRLDNLAEGTYYIRIFWVRHGHSCANVPWNACGTRPDELRPENFAVFTAADDPAPDPPGTAPREKWLQEMARIDGILATAEGRTPAHRTTGVDASWGVLARGRRLPGRSKTGDDRSDDCIVRAVPAQGAALVDGDYNDDGNLVALRQLVRDPHIHECAQAQAAAARLPLQRWLERHGVKLDLLTSSTLMRALETVGKVFVPSEGDPYYPLARSGVVNGRPRVVPLPFINEINTGTPVQPENSPYEPSVQEAEMARRANVSLSMDSGMTFKDGAPRGYPRGVQAYPKFKAVLALEVLPRLARERASGLPVESWDASGLLVDRLHDLPDDLLHQIWSPASNSSIRLGLDGVDLRFGPAFPFEEALTAEGPAAVFAVGAGSHSHFLMHSCLQGAARPNNLAVLERRLKIVVARRGGETSFSVHEHAGPCRFVMQAPDAPPPGSLVASDIAPSCTEPFDLRPFMGMGGGPAAAPSSSSSSSSSSRPLRGPSRCMQDALPRRFVTFDPPADPSPCLRSKIGGGALSPRLFRLCGQIGLA